jgi:hypothetical protein
MIGDSLVCDKPIHREIIQDLTKVSALVTEKAKSKSEYSIQDGSDLKEMINDWLAWARAKGHEPRLSITDEEELKISVVKKVSTEL